MTAEVEIRPWVRNLGLVFAALWALDGVKNVLLGFMGIFAQPPAGLENVDGFWSYIYVIGGVTALASATLVWRNRHRGLAYAIFLSMWLGGFPLHFITPDWGIDTSNAIAPLGALPLLLIFVVISAFLTQQYLPEVKKSVRHFTSSRDEGEYEE